MPAFADAVETAKVMIGQEVPRPLEARLRRVQDLYVSDGGKRFLSRQTVAAIIEQYERETLLEVR